MSKGIEQSGGELFSAVVKLTKEDPAHEVSRALKAFVEASRNLEDPAYAMVPVEYRMALGGMLKMLQMSFGK